MPADAHAQSTGLLPSDAANVNLGDLRQVYNSVLSTEPPATEPGFTTQRAIRVSGFFADPVAPNSGTSASNRSDFGMSVSPSLLINGQTSRLQGTLFLQPQVTLYAHQGSANGFGQSFNGNLHAILVPDTFFVDARATGALTSAEGGFGGSSANGLSRQQMTQTYAFQIAPLLQHRFDGTGTAEIGYTLGETIFSNGGNVANNTPFGTSTPNQNETTNTAHIGFVSVEFRPSALRWPAVRLAEHRGRPRRLAPQRGECRCRLWHNARDHPARQPRLRGYPLRRDVAARYT